MSRLRIFDDADPSAPLSLTADHGSIAAGLERVGVRFERWRTEAVLGPGGRPDVEKIGVFVLLDGYRGIGAYLGKAFSVGKEI